MKKGYIQTIKFLCRLVLAVLPVFIFGEYPEIKNLNSGDLLFRQLQEDIADYYKITNRMNNRLHAWKNQAVNRNDLPALKFFLFTLKGDADLFNLAARLNLPYETIATLNKLDNPESLSSRKTIFIPNLPGIFVPVEPDSDFEEIMTAYRDDRKMNNYKVMLIKKGEKIGFSFFPGARFHPVERAYFLKILFRFPVARGGKISSPFGYRPNPFTGHPEYHNGIDIAALPGTDVYAAREGTVEKVAYNETLGNYLVIAHEGNYKTVYGHLSEIDVKLSQKIDAGMLIGKVGNTGKSTGAHLHFEIIKNGSPRDPDSVFR